MKSRKVRILIRNFAIEVLIYAALVVGYFLLVLRLLGEPLKEFFATNLTPYAFAARRGWMTTGGHSPRELHLPGRRHSLGAEWASQVGLLFPRLARGFAPRLGIDIETQDSLRTTHIGTGPTLSAVGFHTGNGRDQVRNDFHTSLRLGKKRSHGRMSGCVAKNLRFHAMPGRAVRFPAIVGGRLT